MFIQKKSDAPSPGDVVSFRLVTGDEIIGKLIMHTVDLVVVSKPVGIAMQMVNHNQAGIAFAPFQASAPDDRDFSFHTSALLYDPVKVRPQLATNYLSAITGIVLPQDKGLL